MMRQVQFPDNQAVPLTAPVIEMEGNMEVVDAEFECRD